jgi:hypothetical protein
MRGRVNYNLEGRIKIREIVLILVPWRTFFLLQREGGFMLNLGIVHLKLHRKKSK